MSETKLCVENVSMTFSTPARPFVALAPITLAIPQGRFVSLIGPSGCGKSTIFNIIAGLLEPTGGRVLIDGMDATGTIGRVVNTEAVALAIDANTRCPSALSGAFDALDA